MKIIFQEDDYQAYVTSCLKRQQAERIKKKDELARVQIEFPPINTSIQWLQELIDDETGARDEKVQQNQELVSCNATVSYSSSTVPFCTRGRYKKNPSVCRHEYSSKSQMLLNQKCASSSSYGRKSSVYSSQSKFRHSNQRLILENFS